MADFGSFSYLSIRCDSLMPKHSDSILVDVRLYSRIRLQLMIVHTPTLVAVKPGNMGHGPQSKVIELRSHNSFGMRRHLPHCSKFNCGLGRGLTTGILQTADFWTPFRPYGRGVDHTYLVNCSHPS